MRFNGFKGDGERGVIIRNNSIGYGTEWNDKVEYRQKSFGVRAQGKKRPVWSSNVVTLAQQTVIRLFWLRLIIPKGTNGEETGINNWYFGGSTWWERRKLARFA
ncbi:hypothetical protein FJTKL_04544 [Diaporthe vaccinii]|uniref:Pectate lyase n=1 Tax=Diaporthe vaccinii TaxID=105482 RepID=A0ABR4DSW6_9PEZI